MYLQDICENYTHKKFVYCSTDQNLSVQYRLLIFKQRHKEPTINRYP